MCRCERYLCQLQQVVGKIVFQAKVVFLIYRLDSLIDLLIDWLILTACQQVYATLYLAVKELCSFYTDFYIFTQLNLKAFTHSYISSIPILYK